MKNFTKILGSLAPASCAEYRVCNNDAAENSSNKKELYDSARSSPRKNELNLNVFLAKFRMSSLLDSSEISISSFTPPLAMKSLALSSAKSSMVNQWWVNTTLLAEAPIT